MTQSVGSTIFEKYKTGMEVIFGHTSVDYDLKLIFI